MLWEDVGSMLWEGRWQHAVGGRWQHAVGGRWQHVVGGALAACCGRTLAVCGCLSMEWAILVDRAGKIVVAVIGNVYSGGQQTTQDPAN